MKHPSTCRIIETLRLTGLKLLIGLLLFCGPYASAQFALATNKALPSSTTDISADQAVPIDLKRILSDLEKQHDVHFYFDPQLIEGKKVPQTTQPSSPLEEKLTDMLAPLRLKYKRLNDDSYVIQPVSPHKEIRKIQSKPAGAATMQLPDRKDRSLYVPIAAALEQTITGKVTDGESNQPLPGVNVLAKNTTIGTVTDIDGNYRLETPDEATALVFSSIGYQAQEVAIEGRNVINLVMEVDVTEMDEVVVVGYGSVKKSDVTGAVVSLKSEDLNKGLNTSIDQQLQGRAPGVQITQSSAEPGGGVSIRIRGAGSINAGNEPLYVIDGLPIDNTPAVNTTAGFNGNPPARNPLNSLNPSDIESIDILKDASATAIYGSRGANGVILITTKSGVEGKLTATHT